MAYLDDTGLAYFWGKIKAWANSVFALLGHTHPSSDVTAMTGYSMPQASSAISSGDTLNQAVGKLEKAITAADISNVVHRTGDETVDGLKTFVSSETFPNAASSPTISQITEIVLTNNAVTKGVNTLDRNSYTQFVCTDSTGNVASGRTLSLYYHHPATVSANPEASFALDYIDNDNLSKRVRLLVSYDVANSVPFATAPSTSSIRNNATDIVTRDWIPNDTRIVHTTGNESISGEKTFSNTILLATPLIKRNVDNAAIYISGGFDDTHSAILALYGKNVTGGYGGGAFGLVAEDANNRSELWGTPAGHLVWNNENLYNLVHRSGDEDVAGVKTFTGYCWFGADQLLFYSNFARGATLSANSYQMISWRDSTKQVELNSIYRRTNTSDGANDLVFTSTNNKSDGTAVNFYLRRANSGSYLSVGTPLRMDSNTIFRNGLGSNFYVCAGSADGYSHGNYDGALLGLYGINYGGTGSGGNFVLSASSTSAQKQLWGYGNGTLTWSGSPLQVTSDERLKTQMSGVDGAFLDVWGSVQWEQFKFKESVSEKGSGARFHAGLVAQHVKDAFEGSGLDSCGYGILCHEFREAREWDDEVTVADAYVDENGVEHPAQKSVEHHREEAVDLWMVRYEEALCMEAAYQRRENARLKARLAALEERLAALETK